MLTKPKAKTIVLIVAIIAFAAGSLLNSRTTPGKTIFVCRSERDVAVVEFHFTENSSYSWARLDQWCQGDSTIVFMLRFSDAITSVNHVDQYHRKGEFQAALDGFDKALKEGVFPK